MPEGKRQIYLDHNATTPVLPEVCDVLLRYYREDFGNPSSVHHYGRRARVAVDEARDSVAALLDAPASSISFSSGGTEANNTILKGLALAGQGHGRHLVTSQIEHPAVLDTCAALEQLGYRVTYVPVDTQGVVSPEAVQAALTDETIGVSIMYANNETGVLQPIADIARVVRARGIAMHTDAVQAFGKMPLRVEALGVDFLSFSGHKLYAPKGVGGWYARPGMSLPPLLHGGHQERGMRSGTENVAGIAALGKACEIASRDMAQEWARQQQLQQRLEHGIQERIADVCIQGCEAPRLPNTSNIAFAGAEGEALMMRLDLQGVAISTGSACSSGSLEPSHVLHAMGVPEAYMHGALRLSLGRSTTLDDIEYVLSILPGLVENTRALSIL
ncbi:MAG: cysteine desulfurase [Candidatus Tectomicrobia bacterium]|uniref:cysteine desulfurase n=1 Tax=Tectimicrobiota bacterium TaxID=2528274 RepID=A0A937W762_UNCTE|nr:cysteine desulfurase [Candidatus Tectomicrobia bacterium]